MRTAGGRVRGASEDHWLQVGSHAPRRAGYAAVEDELAYGVVAVAVPVRDASGRVVAALNSSSHSRRITKAKLVRERLEMLKETSAQISTELSRVPGLAMSVLA